MAINHIFFDLDRTLWDFETNSHEELVNLYHVHKLHQRGISLQNEFIKVYKKINHHCWEDYRKNLITKEKLRSERFMKTLLHFGIDDKKLANELGDDYVHNSPNRTILIDGAIDLLEALKDHFHMHIITNGFEEVQWVKLRNSKLLPYFKEVITSEAVGVKKPDPKIFQFAVEKANATVVESVMIGDDLKTDIIGAIQIGMKCIYYNPHGNVNKYPVWREVKSLLKIKEILI